jgi:hypothetical protein
MESVNGTKRKGVAEYVVGVDSAKEHWRFGISDSKRAVPEELPIPLKARGDDGVANPAKNNEGTITPIGNCRGNFLRLQARTTRANGPISPPFLL